MTATPSNDATPACEGRSWLFGSLNPADHLDAASYCAECPVLDWCREWTEASIERSTVGGSIEGTWAGQLYGAPKDALRQLREEQMFTMEEARAAHAAWWRNEKTSRNRVGERVYQRRMARTKPSRRIA